MPSTQPSTLPRYKQIGEMILRDIKSGRLMDGERLDPEREMAVQMGTSVGTLRKALATLEEEGLLERRQGSGNYVRRKGSRDTSYSFFRIERAGGDPGDPSAEVLSAGMAPKPADAPDFGESDVALRIRRLRRLDNVPAVVEEIWLDGRYGERLDAAKITDSLYATYKRVLNLWIMRAEDRVSIAKALAWTPAVFGKDPGEPCGFVERIGFSQTGARVEWSRSWFDPDEAHYVQRLK